MNQREIKNLEKKLEELLKNKEEVLFCYLFGSMAYQKPTSKSDIDLALYLDKRTIQNFF
ncbi:MAG: nucleotidyltransferase domain-containing protein [Candidatus Pacebacteria bacterium]|nr:nucleotidyltransferase domain-containing protein [Candidatus Paceibacterota bacterium]